MSRSSSKNLRTRWPGNSLIVARCGTYSFSPAACAFLRLFERRFPEIVMEMRGVLQRGLLMPDHDFAVLDLYDRLPELDFSRHVLEGQESILRMLPVPQCGWSDLGTPKRVAETLRRLPNESMPADALQTAVFLNLAAQHAY